MVDGPEFGKAGLSARRARRVPRRIAGRLKTARQKNILQKKLAKLKKEGHDSGVTAHSLKLCFNPNIARYRDGQHDGLFDSTKKFFRDITGCQDTFEVFFYENIPSLATENLDEWKTGYSLSKELVEETIKCLNKQKSSSFEKNG